MGVPMSRNKRGSAPVVKRVPNDEVAPLTTLNELLEYKEEPLLCAVEPLSEAIERGKPGDPRTIFATIWTANYKEDRFIHGTDEAHGYRFHHWQVIDTFIYYSHNMVTIPPPGWISAAHRHAVKVLGTFILGEDGTKTINTIRCSGLASQVAAQLANVARVGRFDGWLISIGCKMLNEKNTCFFVLCDGIFLNFCWTENLLLRSARVAGNRKADVYAGVDVYARETSYPGGYDMYKVVKPAPWFDLSKQQLQPRDQGTNLCGGGGSAILSTMTSYTGGGCLLLQYCPEKAPGSTVTPYFRLFGFDLPLGSLRVSYTFKNEKQGSLAGHDVNLMLRVRDAVGKEEELSLGSIVAVPHNENYIAEREIANSPQGDLGPIEVGWLTRKYHVEDTTGSAILEEIGISFNSNEEMASYIGELVVKRPEVTTGGERAKDPDTKTAGQHDQAEEGLGSIAFDYSMSSDESD
ncbi:hypothetical protein HPB52_017578 [Rhipicephalus sanguineus]|uniref:Cytosolic endo-beta-N-acetylglucosaminidase TIM barrel domain-containing protein n=1 Tax=Rhipicephalus sanguineus TaxID=34632 RepID=A0A9D4PMB3_RHISA|nr:hypothetical protein HPB52_017578 [Rhipicephalus sanguineus]